jgi:hypothetical protein
VEVEDTGKHASLTPAALRFIVYGLVSKMQNYQVEPLFISLPKIEMERDKLDVRTFAFIRLVELEIKKKLFLLRS